MAEDESKVPGSVLRGRNRDDGSSYSTSSHGSTIASSQEIQLEVPQPMHSCAFACFASDDEKGRTFSLYISPDVREYVQKLTLV